MRLGCIDGLRGYLALGVFIHHFVITWVYKVTGEWKPSGIRFFSNCGEVGVCLFFMITGFLFVDRLLRAREEGKPVDWTRFYITRIFRLFPLYAVCVGMIFLIVFAVGGTELRETPFVLLKRAVQWMLLWTPDINHFPNTHVIIAGVTWTLRFEWVFYLALPLIALMLRTRSKLLLLVAAATTLYFFARPVRIAFLGESTEYFALFWMGGLAAHAYRFERLRRFVQKPAMAWLAAAALLVVLFGFDDALDTLPVLLMTLCFVSVALGNPLGGLLNLRASILLGEVSYGIYLLHGIVLYLVFSVFAPNAMQSATNPVALWVWLPFVGAVVVLAAWLSHRFIEQPGIALGKTLGKKLATRLHREEAA